MGEMWDFRVVLGSREAAVEVMEAVEAATTEKASLVERHGIDGAAIAGFVVLASTTIKTLPALLDAIGRLVAQQKVVQVLEFPDQGVRLVNPTPQSVAAAFDRLLPPDQRATSGE